MKWRRVQALAGLNSRCQSAGTRSAASKFASNETSQVQSHVERLDDGQGVSRQGSYALHTFASCSGGGQTRHWQAKPRFPATTVASKRGVIGPGGAPPIDQSHGQEEKANPRLWRLGLNSPREGRAFRCPPPPFLGQLSTPSGMGGTGGRRAESGQTFMV